MPNFKVETDGHAEPIVVSATFYQTDEHWVNFYEGIGMDKVLLASFPSRAVLSVMDPDKAGMAPAKAGQPASPPLAASPPPPPGPAAMPQPPGSLPGMAQPPPYSPPAQPQAPGGPGPNPPGSW